MQQSSCFSCCCLWFLAVQYPGNSPRYFFCSLANNSKGTKSCGYRDRPIIGTRSNIGLMQGSHSHITFNAVQTKQKQRAQWPVVPICQRACVTACVLHI